MIEAAPRSLSVSAKARLALRIWRLYLTVQMALWREPFPDFVARLGETGPVPRRVRYSPARLSRAVDRSLRLGGWQPKCLAKALVLYRLLREDGEPAEVVIGLREGARDQEAHAWVELHRQDMGPPPGRSGHQPLARFA